MCDAITARRALGLALALLTGAAMAATPAERDAAFAEYVANPGDQTRALRYARLASELGDYEGALGVLEGVLTAGGDGPSLRLELGALYLRLGSYASAVRHLEAAMTDANAGPAQKRRAAELLALADARDGAHGIEGNVTGGVRWRSNANFGPDSLTVRALGIDVPLPEAIREEDDVDFFLVAGARHSYDLKRQDHLAIETTGFLFGNRHVELDQFDDVTAEITTGPRWQPFAGRVKGLTFRPHLIANVVLRDDDLNSNAFGGGLETRLLNEGPLSLSGLYQYRDREFHATDERPFVDQRDGHEHFGALTGRWRVTERLALVGRADVIDRNTERRFTDSTEYGVLGRLEYGWRSPFGPSWGGLWRSYFAAGWRGVEFDAPNPQIDPARAREDDEWRLALGHSVPFIGGWRLNLEVGGSVVDSNLPNFERDNIYTTLSATLPF